MMRCNIIEDLLPEYVDGMCQPETAEEIEKHLKECSSCLEKFERMQKDTMENELQNMEGMGDIRPFQKISKVLKAGTITNSYCPSFPLWREQL